MEFSRAAYNDADWKLLGRPPLKALTFDQVSRMEVTVRAVDNSLFRCTEELAPHCYKWEAGRVLPNAYSPYSYKNCSYEPEPPGFVVASFQRCDKILDSFYVILQNGSVWRHSRLPLNPWLTLVTRKWLFIITFLAGCVVAASLTALYVLKRATLI
jgi:hypothetical protein